MTSFSANGNVLTTDGEGIGSIGQVYGDAMTRSEERLNVSAGRETTSRVRLRKCVIGTLRKGRRRQHVPIAMRARWSHG